MTSAMPDMEMRRPVIVTGSRTDDSHLLWPDHVVINTVQLAGTHMRLRGTNSARIQSLCRRYARQLRSL